jgi:hypothetical protein
MDQNHARTNLKNKEQRESDHELLGLKEISKINAAKVKRKENSSQNRRHLERRKVTHSD